LPTGVAAMLEPAPTWQLSHDALVGMWLPGRPTMLKPTAGIAKLVAAAPWHCAQLLVVLCALAWMAASVGITEKSLVVWQALHCAAAAYGMWFAGLSCAVKKFVPLWHCEQSPLAGCAASAMLKVPPADRGRVWKPVYWAPGIRVVGAIGYAVIPIHTEFASWQLAQPPVTPVWICAVVGAGVANAVPGAVLVAAAAICPLGTLARWQDSHAVLDGMCDDAPTGEVGGIATIWPIPTKVAPLMPGPWHDAHALVIPAWLMREPENLAPLPTGVAAMLEPAPTWQLSHDALVGMWLPGRPTMLKPTAGIAKLVAAAPWHCAQLLVVLCALAWMAASVGITEKSLVVWQALHCAAAAYGM
jgi:uncharacterized membrane protein YuzA (DUF378 family)